MFFPGRLQHLPPLITAATSLAKAGCNVTVIAFGSSANLINILTDAGVSVKLLSMVHPKSFIGKAVLWCKGIAYLYYKIASTHPDYIWHHQCHYAVWYAVLACYIFKAPTIMHSHELTCHVRWRWFWQKHLARLSSFVIVPEINRAWILKMLSFSTAEFVMIPNNNYSTSFSESCPNKSFDILTFFRSSGGSSSCNKFLIYQGAILENRALLELISAFMQIDNPEIGLIIMGEKNAFSLKLEAISSADTRIIFTSFIQPPDHLLVTRSCFAGIVLYKPISLNSVYCAPNKIYEYAAFDLPMLLPDYPGLASIVSQYSLGHLCNPVSIVSIRDSIMKLINEDIRGMREGINHYYKHLPSTDSLYDSLTTNLQEYIK